MTEGTAVSRYGTDMAGLRANRPAAGDGRPGVPAGLTFFCTDTLETFMSVGSGNWVLLAPGQTDKLITSAQLLALNATPQTIVAAPGAGRYREFLGAQILYDYNSTAYAGIAAGEDLVFKYTDGSGAAVSQQIEATGFLDQTADEIRTAGKPGGDLADVEPVVNAALVLHLLTGEITTGDSPLKVRCFHRTILLSDLEAIA